MQLRGETQIKLIFFLKQRYFHSSKNLSKDREVWYDLISAQVIIPKKTNSQQFKEVFICLKTYVCYLYRKYDLIKLLFCYINIVV